MTIENFKFKVLNRLLEWCELNEKNINETDQLFLNDLTLTAVDNVLNYLEKPDEKKLEYLKYYIVSCICAAYNIGHSKAEQHKRKIDESGEEWKNKV